MTDTNFTKSRALAQSAEATLGRAAETLMSWAAHSDEAHDSYHAVFGLVDATGALLRSMASDADLDALMHAARTLQALIRAVAAALPGMTGDSPTDTGDEIGLAVEAVGATAITIGRMQDMLLAAQEAVPAFPSSAAP